MPVNAPDNSPQAYMSRALDLAIRGVGRATPNPLVGAVIVKDDTIVGEGFHVYSERRHAEIVALEKAGEGARDADLFVNLEPCCHTGRTPPCVDAIQRAGIRRVYVATPDPNPLVSGKGISRLQEYGIEVIQGLCSEKASRINASFFHLMAQGRPLVTLKLGLSLDGRLATRTGDSRWVTSPASRKIVHRLRFESDAILTGISTVLADDPSLNVRWTRSNSITKVVLDSQLRTPLGSKLFESGDRVIVFCSHRASRKRAQALSGRADVIRVKRDGGGLMWDEILKHLGQQRIASLLVEGGGRVAASALRAGAVRKVRLFYGPKFIGGDGVPSLASLSLSELSNAPQVTVRRVRRLGNDILLEGDMA